MVVLHPHGRRRQNKYNEIYLSVQDVVILEQQSFQMFSISQSGVLINYQGNDVDGDDSLASS